MSGVPDMRTLIIPDIHNHTAEVENLLVSQPHDRAVFLGDYFDSYGDTPEDARRTAEWLRESLTHPERIHLFGNHDLPYAFPDTPELHCPGWSPEKHSIIAEILHAPHWEQLRLTYATGHLLCCHAGVSRRVFEHPLRGLTMEGVTETCAAALRNARGGLMHPALAWSPVPDDGCSGITWLRWWEMEVQPEFCQVVGHTPGDLRIRRKGGRFNVCLDTGGAWIGVIEAGVLSVLQTATGTRREIGVIESDGSPA